MMPCIVSQGWCHTRWRSLPPTGNTAGLSSRVHAAIKGEHIGAGG